MTLNKKLDLTIGSACMIILLSFAVLALTGCETWRGMGKDTRNVTNKTANTMNNVMGGNKRKY